ncbi:sulfate permease [bacterium]|nr:sulfate permease [bacterium]
MLSKIFYPQSLSLLKEGYSKERFLKDLIAGVIVGIVALPLSIAFGIASGVKPEQGIFTAIIAGFLISFFSGSKVQIGGPTGAFIVIVYGIVQQYGYEGLAIATIISGFLLILMGILRLGSVIQFIPYPVTVGFTSGIALIIFSGQIKDFFGLTIEKTPSDFIEKMGVIFSHLSTINLYALGIGLGSIIIIKFWPKVTSKIPGSLVAIIISTTLVQLFSFPVETIGSKFGAVPSMLPTPSIPSISWELFQKMFSPALTIALLAGIESLLSAVVADGMIGDKHRSNTELIAQGIANIFSPIFLGIPATGAIARTATNIKNGGRTPVAGVVHAITLLLILLFFGKWASLIPMASLAAILIFVAYNMSEIHIFIKLLKSPKSDIIVLITTFLLTVLIDLTVAIQIGVVMAAFLFMHRMANATQLKFFSEDSDPEDPLAISKKTVPEGVEVFEINGPFFFGAADRFKDQLKKFGRSPKILILRMRHVLTIDATGIRALEDVISNCKKEGCEVILSGVHAQPYIAIEKAGTLKLIAEENLCMNIDLALERANEILRQI